MASTRLAAWKGHDEGVAGRGLSDLRRHGRDVHRRRGRGRVREFTLAKSPTTLDRASTAIRPPSTRSAKTPVSLATDILRGASTVIYGTTRATNAVVERKTPRVAFFTTAGFPDILLLREGGKPAGARHPLLARARAAPPHVRGCPSGRRTTAGVAPLDEARVVRDLHVAVARGAEAIGVCLLWSVVAPEHERRIGELIERELPGIPFTLSHAVNPVIREYRRAASTVSTRR